MRIAWWMILVVGCELGTSNRDTAATGKDCDVTGWAPPASAGMTILKMQVDAAIVPPVFNPTKVYADYGPSACNKIDAVEARWIVESDGNPYAIVRAAAAQVGDVNLVNPGSDYLEIDYLEEDLVFEDTDFQTGIWNVESVEPVFEFTLQGQAVKDGRTLTVNLAAQITPDQR